MKFVDPNNEIFDLRYTTCENFHYYYMEQNNLAEFISYCERHQMTDEDVMIMIEAAYGQMFLKELISVSERITQLEG